MQKELPNGKVVLQVKTLLLNLAYKIISNKTIKVKARTQLLYETSWS